jgi:DNA-binding CsgD family transcriptional regulator
LDKLLRVRKRLDEAALDPSAWAHACDALAHLFEASGTLILPQSAESGSHIMPHSENLAEAVDRFIGEGWYLNDFRARGYPKARATGTVTDGDLISEDDMRRHPYYQELLAPCDLKWFIGTTISTLGTTWGVAIHANARRGAFEAADAKLLLATRSLIETAANRSAALGFQRIQLVEDLLAAGDKGTAILSRTGKILVANRLAEDLMVAGGLSRGAYLQSQDQYAEAKLGILRGRLTVAGAPTGPISLPGRDGRSLLLDLIPMPRDFGAVFSGAAAFLIIQELAAPSNRQMVGMMVQWKLTNREAELARHLAAGMHLADAARDMKLSVGTARQYLKSIFKKTGSNRQAELVLKLTALAGDY